MMNVIFCDDGRGAAQGCDCHRNLNEGKEENDRNGNADEPKQNRDLLVLRGRLGTKSLRHFEMVFESWECFLGKGLYRRRGTVSCIVLECRYRIIVGLQLSVDICGSEALLRPENAKLGGMVDIKRIGGSFNIGVRQARLEVGTGLFMIVDHLLGEGFDVSGFVVLRRQSASGFPALPHSRHRRLFAQSLCNTGPPSKWWGCLIHTHCERRLRARLLRYSGRRISALPSPGRSSRLPLNKTYARRKNREKLRGINAKSATGCARLRWFRLRKTF
jgi:hypothetical protein